MARVGYERIQESQDPEVLAARFAWRRMSKGAIMVFDDYGFKAHSTQREMLDAWATQEGILGMK